MFKIIGCKDLCKTFRPEVFIIFLYFALSKSSLCSSIPACRDTIDAFNRNLQGLQSLTGGFRNHFDTGLLFEDLMHRALWKTSLGLLNCHI